MYRNGLKSVYLNNTSMARCKDKRKVRTKIASHFLNVWKCMDKKILKPLKKSDFALPSKDARKRQIQGCKKKSLRSEEQDH